MDFLFRGGLLSDPTTNGVPVFVIGMLFILSVYHLFLYFQNGIKAYLLYSFYTFLIFIRHTMLGQGDVFDQMLGEFRPMFIESGVKDFIVWIYNCIYFYFVFRFVDLKYKGNKVNKFLWWFVTALTALAVVLQITCFISGSREPMNFGYEYIFIPAAVVASLIGIYAVVFSGSAVRYYALAGSLMLLISSLITTGVGFTDVQIDIDTADNFRYNIFYIGVMFENFLFALGLGSKQRNVIKERNESQEELIAQLQENESLRETLKQRLEQEVIQLSSKAEEQELERLKAQYESELAELKISSLRNQMNPHFIFNSLNSIKLYIINNDTSNAVYYLNKFSKLIRKILATTKEQAISLNEELETAELYMNIENIRFKNELNFSIKVDEGINLNMIKVPPLILQPIIENAIWHGLSLKEGEKNIVISARHNSTGNLTLSVEDNGVGRTKAAEVKQRKLYKKDSIGMSLTSERMERFAKEFDTEFSMSVIDLGTEESPEGTRVELNVPFHQGAIKE
jgi:sensor histidine kinase YesM